MTTRLKEVDAVMVGMGWTGAILARELTKAGVNVVGLERGADRHPAEEFTLTRLRDELRTWRLFHIALNYFPGFGDLSCVPLISVAGIDDTLVEFRGNVCRLKIDNTHPGIG